MPVERQELPVPLVLQGLPHQVDKVLEIVVDLQVGILQVVLRQIVFQAVKAELSLIQTVLHILRDLPHLILLQTLLLQTRTQMYKVNLVVVVLTKVVMAIMDTVVVMVADMDTDMVMEVEAEVEAPGEAASVLK